MIANENSNKNLLDTLSPLEMRITSQVDNLVRDHAAMRGYLTKINDIINDIASLEEKLAVRPTLDDIDTKLERFKDYATVKAFQGLQRIVSQKAESITQDEMRVLLDATTHRCTRLENQIFKIESDMTATGEKFETADYMREKLAHD